MSRSIPSSEVAQHDQPGDLWLVYKGKVYDLSEYYAMHPGGDAMLRQAGKVSGRRVLRLQDVSLVLATVPAHGFALGFIHKKLAECCVGELS